MQALGLIWGDVDSRAPDYWENATRLDAPAHPGAVATLRAWRERQGADGFRVGRDIPSRALSRVLRNLAVCEPIEEARDFRIRIAGTAFYRRFGRDITGERFSNLFACDTFAHNRSILIETMESGIPASIGYERAHGSRVISRHECLVLPVFSPDGAARWALTGLFFDDWAR